MNDKPIHPPLPENIKPDDTLCIDCSVLANEEERKACEDLTNEMGKGNIDLELFSAALIDKVGGDDEKFLSVFCDPDKEPEKTEGAKERP